MSRACLGRAKCRRERAHRGLRDNVGGLRREFNGSRESCASANAISSMLAARRMLRTAVGSEVGTNRTMASDTGTSRRTGGLVSCPGARPAREGFLRAVTHVRRLVLANAATAHDESIRSNFRGESVTARRSVLLQIVPSTACLHCDVCCRFPSRPVSTPVLYGGRNSVGGEGPVCHRGTFPMPGP